MMTIQTQRSVSIGDPKILRQAYQVCLAMAREHYENFPVASLLLPRDLRPHVAAVYAFARRADDMADEGTRMPYEREEELARWRDGFMRAFEEASGDPVLLAVSDTARKFAIPPKLFHDLLDAFEQDVFQQEYDTFDQVLAYCSRSANPIGRILLHFFQCSNAKTLPPADALCTGLQLVNFWQDVLIDLRKPRIYLPREDRERFRVSTADLAVQPAPEGVRRLIAFEVERTRPFFRDALALLPLVPLRLRLELKAIWRGGMRILDRIAAEGYDPISHRPNLRRKDKLGILLGSLFPVPHDPVAYADRR